MAKGPETTYNATFRHARKEAWLILLAWLLCLIWTVGYSAFAGYDVAVEDIKLVLGMPAWVFWGVLAPWAAATTFSVWFGLFYMKDDTLDENESGSLDR